MQRPKSQTNAGAGFGYWTNLQGKGNYENAVLVQMFGKRNSHLELDLGVKYVYTRSDIRNILLLIIYAGYRFEKPDGRFLFRAGFSLTSLFNVGIGFKF